MKIPGSAVHLWRFSTAGLAETAARSHLPDDERAYIERMTSESAKRQIAASQAGLRLILSQYIATAPREIRFRRGSHGKPFLDESHGSALQFNLSHSHERGVVAICAHREVGVDLEKVRERDAADRLAARYFSETERAAFAAAPPEERLATFFRLWTRKEGYLKATGTGLSVPLRPIDTLLPNPPGWVYHDFELDRDYVASIVCASPAPDHQYFDLGSLE